MKTRTSLAVISALALGAAVALPPVPPVGAAGHERERTPEEIEQREQIDVS